ncbi:extracellular solute-binding protein [Demequina sp. TTPB684]|uniref:ABC transporter substrate-binding protein n=1 Tax=unclassified Demequina TaxID=2620311 RepID=UPI001CF33ECA|nr:MULTISPECIES: extracellular solute-binding protein [unclassified Demequina]MCB2413440.1 extracellular solute-binding protein [Demequina sp. TTPB684]UPU88745.1 extracellular solute-binding protein [Demequina sp. TMPB413]
MANMRRSGVIAALAASSALLLAACSSGGDDPAPTNSGTANGSDEPVTITWWHNATADPALTFWQTVADEFEAANPNVTVEVEGIQNEDLQRTRIPVALQSGEAPDLFQQWGGGEMVAQVNDGYLKDISAMVADDVERLGGSVAPWQVDGKTYGLPYQFGPEGIWYRPSLFEAAGIDEVPSTLDELSDAVQKLKDAGIEPIAVGAADGWPAAHWWYNFALQSCPSDVLQAANSTLDFSDECFVTAGEKLQEFIDTEPFNSGYAATSAQQGATSSAGLVANGNAAMELMGQWNVSVMTGLVDDTEALVADLSWFPFPSIEGSQGDPTAMLGGGDGYSCYVDAPDACVDLLKYITSDDVLTRFASEVGGIPAAPAAHSGITDPNLQVQAEYMAESDYLQLWLDTSYGPTVGAAMNDAIIQLFAGNAAPADIPAAMTAAAGQ